MASADTHVVKPDGTGDFPTIQDAVNGSVAGDVIELTDGVFTGAGNRDVDYMGKDLIIRSQSGDPATCVIDCEGTDLDNHRGFDFGPVTPAAVLEGVTVRNGYITASTGGGLYCFFGSPTIRNCIVTACYAAIGGGVYVSGGSVSAFEDCVLEENTATNGGGMFCLDASPTMTRCSFFDNLAVGSGGALFGSGNALPSIEQCTIAGNSANFDGGAVKVINGSSPTFASSTLYGNAATQGGGAYIDRPSAITFLGTIIAFSPSGEAVFCEPGDYGALLCCDLYGNAGGDWTGSIAGDLGVAGNVSLDPLFCGPAIRDFHVDVNSPCLSDGACGQIGAWGAGCDGFHTGVNETAREGASWGGVKNRFADGDRVR